MIYAYTLQVDLLGQVICVTVHCNLTTFTYLLTYFMEQNPSWEANRYLASQEIPRIFMETEGSLPRLQVPANCPYPEPVQSSQFNNI